MNKSFLHAGTFGDTIYALNVIKILGGGDIHIELNGVDNLSRRVWGGGDGGWHSGRYTQSDIDFMKPLIKSQSYINNVFEWDNKPVTYDLREQYKFWANRNGKIEDWAGNQTECYALACGLDIHKHRRALLIDPWLDNIEPIKIPGRPIVINRTFRHIHRDQRIVNPQWMNWITENSLEDTCLFVGTKKEHSDFCEIHNCDVKHREVEDMLELARIIQGAEQFIGNQSMALSLAIGLGKTFWCEIRINYENTKTPHGYGDVWFPRSNGHYF